MSKRLIERAAKAAMRKGLRQMGIASSVNDLKADLRKSVGLKPKGKGNEKRTN